MMSESLFRLVSMNPAGIEESALARRVEVLEQLAANDPSTYSARLAWETGKLGDLYGEAGIESERLACYERAADIMRARTQAPDAVASDHWDLQQHLFNVASVSRQVDQPRRGLGAIQEALERAHYLDPATAPLTLLFGVYLSDRQRMEEACRVSIDLTEP